MAPISISFFGRRGDKGSCSQSSISFFGRRSGNKGSCSQSSLSFFERSDIRIDWKETLEAHVVKMEVPGIKKEDLKVVAEDKLLQVKGGRRKEVEDVNDTWHILERNTWSFVRSIALPNNARMEELQVGLEDGILTIIVPKVPKETKHQPKSFEISNKGFSMRPEHYCCVIVILVFFLIMFTFH
ncbi:hypothetical protein Sjap_009798 [Stephania japonica]|uniref:SHSP domain-containing protein n=1 Tax=Stephania japonica TaxID=461633 RepID=A0AAP0P6J4_9MAGN